MKVQKKKTVTNDVYYIDKLIVVGITRNLIMTSARVVLLKGSCH